MANRFLDTNYYKSPFVKALPGKLKSFYSFIICDCTAAGIWCLDLDAAKHYTGFEVTMEEFQSNFISCSKAIKITKGKYFFPDFIEHQYPGGLSDANKAHKNILIELRKFNLLDSTNLPKKEGSLEGSLEGPLKGVQGNGQGNGNGNGQGNGELPKEIFPEQDDEILISQQLLVPEMLSAYVKTNPSHPKAVDKDFNPLHSISIFIHKQLKLNGNHVENKAIIIKKWEQLCSVIAEDGFYKQKALSVISNHIQEIYQIQQNGKPKTNGTHQKSDGIIKSAIGAHQLIDSLKQGIAKR